MKERDIQQEVIRVLSEWKRQGEPVYWLNLPGSAHLRKGTPDLLVVYHGRACLIEIKLPGKLPTLLQSRELREWRNAGAVAVVVTSADEAIRCVKTCSATPTIPRPGA